MSGMTAAIWKAGARKLRGENIAERHISLADRRFKSERELAQLLDDVFGDDWSDYTTDWYDRSIEVLGVGDRVLSIAEQAKIWRAGFARMWTHCGDEKCKPGERVYGARSPDAGCLTAAGKETP